MSLQEILDVLDATPGLEKSLYMWANSYEFNPPPGVEFVKCESELKPDRRGGTDVKHVATFKQNDQEYKVRFDFQWGPKSMNWDDEGNGGWR